MHCEVKPMPNVVRLLNVCGKYKNLKQYGKKKTHKIEKRSDTADNQCMPVFTDDCMEGCALERRHRKGKRGARLHFREQPQ